MRVIFEFIDGEPTIEIDYDLSETPPNQLGAMLYHLVPPVSSAFSVLAESIKGTELEGIYKDFTDGVDPVVPPETVG
jgi:hypothetical protein